MKIDISKLPTRAGWGVEVLIGSGGSIISFHAPEAAGGGFVTIDFDRRVFAAGYGRPGTTHLPSTKTYAGRGWQHAIVTDAMDWLQSVMKS